MKKVLSPILILATAIFAFSVQAAPLSWPTQVDSSESERIEIHNDFLSRSSPRETITSLFKAFANQNYKKASLYMDLSQISRSWSDSSLISYVKKIEITLNKHGRMLPMRLISKDHSGDLKDDLEPGIDNVGYLYLADTRYPIYLESIALDSTQNIWVLSSTTIDNLNSYIQSNKDTYSNGRTLADLYHSSGKSSDLAGWIAMIFLALVSYLASYFILRLAGIVIRSLLKGSKISSFRIIFSTISVPLRLVLTVFIVLNVSRLLEVPIMVRQAFGVVNLIVLWTALFIFIWLLINTISNLSEERLREKNKFGGLAAISFFQNSAKFSLVIIAILIAFDTLGFNITAGIAALGVGGIALALGAQKTVENLVGGLSIVFDQPVNVGDFCKFGDTVGTVEKIGVRSTRVRTLNRTLVSIPNADFSTRSIENYALRDMFLYKTTIGLRYETSSDQMRYILVELRKILYAHPKVDPDPARVRFLGYASDCLEVEIFAYTHAIDWNDFLAIQEDINLRLAKVIEDSGTGFAFPSQTVYLAKDSGLSKTKTENTEAKVQEWIKNAELELPDFDEKTIQSLKDSLQYPSEGSKNRKDK